MCKRFCFFIFALLLLSLGLTPTITLSQETEDQADDDQQNISTYTDSEVLVTARRKNESLEDPAAFVEIIEMKDFKGRFVTAQEAVSQAAGVTVRDFGGLGKLSTVSIRGSTSQQVLVLIDGVRINPSTGGGADLSSIPASQIERIEVIRGGGSALYGEGAIGGVVNIITKKHKGKAINTLGATVGSFNTLEIHASRSHGFDLGSYLVSGSYLHTDGNFTYLSDNGTALDKSDDHYKMRKNNATDDRNFLLKGNYTPNEHFDLSLQSSIHSALREIPGMVSFPSEHACQKELRNITQINAAIADLPISGLLFKTQAANRYNNQIFSDKYGEQTGVPLETDYTEYEPRLAQTIQYLWSIWEINQLFTLRGEWYRTILRESKDQFDNVERDSWSISLSDQFITWDDRLTFVPAIRYDSASGIGEQWSPKFGVSLMPYIRWLVLKANVGRSFRAPNFSELYFNQGYVESNPDLKPETALNYDAGVQIRTTPFFGEVAYFRSEVEDQIEYLLVSGFRYKPYNIGKVRLEGMEATGVLKPWEYTSLTGSFTMIYAIDETGLANRDGNQVPGIPRYKAYTRLEGGPSLVKVFGEYHFIGKNFITQANTKLLDERHILNLGIIGHPVSEVSIGVEMKNVLDDQAVDVRGFPLPGRSVFLSVEAIF